MWPLSILPKVQRKNYDLSGMGRYIGNILQWEPNDIKSRKMTNGDYSMFELSFDRCVQLLCTAQHCFTGGNVQHTKALLLKSDLNSESSLQMFSKKNKSFGKKLTFSINFLESDFKCLKHSI